MQASPMWKPGWRGARHLLTGTRLFIRDASGRAATIDGLDIAPCRTPSEATVSLSPRAHRETLDISAQLEARPAAAACCPCTVKL
jgi:hypothetical protein